MIVASWVLLFLSACEAALHRRSFATYEADLNKVNNDTVVVENQVKAYIPGVGGRPIQVQALDQDLVTCGKDNRGITTITTAQITAACNYLSNTLYPNTKAMLDAFVAKKTQFTSAGLQAIVLSELIQLRNDTGPCVTISPKTASCASVPKKFDAAYASAIAVYNS